MSGSGEKKKNSVIQFRDAVALVDGFPAVSGVSLRVDPGEIILVEGSNGAGKTTFLHLCAGLCAIASGEGSVLGHDLSTRQGRRKVRRLTGLLAHKNFLYDELTIEQNVHFWAKANKIDVGTCEPVMERLGVASRLRNVQVKNLSTGQRRRTALAVLVSRRPRLWLLDEPYAGLDAAGRELVEFLIKNAVEFGATVLLSSHNSSRAKKLASRSVELKGGYFNEGETTADSVSEEKNTDDDVDISWELERDKDD